MDGRGLRRRLGRRSGGFFSFSGRGRWRGFVVCNSGLRLGRRRYCLLRGAGLRDCTSTFLRSRRILGRDFRRRSGRWRLLDGSGRRRFWRRRWRLCLGLRLRSRLRRCHLRHRFRRWPNPILPQPPTTHAGGANQQNSSERPCQRCGFRRSGLRRSSFLSGRTGHRGNRNIRRGPRAGRRTWGAG